MTPPRREDDVPPLLPRSFLRPCLLLLLSEEEAHGYDLLEKLGELSVARTDPGGLYRTLRALEREGLVRSWWEPSAAGPPRRSYALTDEGTEWLHLWAGTLRETVRVLRRFLERYAEVAGTGRRAGTR